MQQQEDMVKDVDMEGFAKAVPKVPPGRSSLARRERNDCGVRAPEREVPVPTAVNPTAQIRRPARALIGWMSVVDGKLWLAGRQANQQDRPEYTERVEKARDIVAARRPGVDQSDVLTEPAGELADHINALRQQPAGAGMFNEGFRVSVADLSKVCAIQPHVYTDQASERVATADRGDISSLASISLPIPKSVPLAAQFDESKRVWVFASADPNLRIAGHFRAEISPGVSGFGFVVDVPTSFLQVVMYQGRYLLRDGYHRAYAFLQRGITRVPVMTREFGTFNEMTLPPGLLPQDAYLGSRPPLLVDYLDDQVSAPIEMPAIHKMVIVQGLELGTMG